ncbi:MAG: L,D-transpeptidase family protein [Pseudomonadota bacterium]
MSVGPADLVVGRWGARFCGRSFPCAIGWGGVRADKREGDGATPAGRFALRAVYARSAAGRDVVGRSIGPRLHWSDDPTDPGYNMPFVGPGAGYRHERLYRPDLLYDIVAALDYNWPSPTAFAGSAIFLHIWRAPRYPTQGCVAFARRDLVWILSRWRSQCRVEIRT